MQHDLIPARNREIADALRRGVPVETIARLFALSEYHVRQIGRQHGVDMRALRARTRQERVAAEGAWWKPSTRAQAVLDHIGWDLDEQVPNRPRCGPRDAALLESVLLSGDTLTQVGARFDLTRERVRQILNKHTGLTSRRLETYRAEMRTAQRHAAALAYAEANPAATLSQIAAATGLRVNEVREAIGAEETLRRAPRQTWIKQVPDEVVFEEMTRIAALPGGTPLSGPFYEEHRGEGSLTRVRIMQRFGTWSNACALAGVPSRKPLRSHYPRNWSEQDLLDWSMRYLAVDGANATFNRFTDWLREHKKEGAPSALTVRNTFGTWHGIVDAALNSALPAPSDETLRPHPGTAQKERGQA